jgi:hypothetical protein
LVLLKKFGEVGIGEILRFFLEGCSGWFPICFADSQFPDDFFFYVLDCGYTLILGEVGEVEWGFQWQLLFF